MRATKITIIFCLPFLLAQIGCSGDPKLKVQNTYSSMVFYEITFAGEPSAYLSGQMPGKVRNTLTLRAGRNLLLFVNPDTSAGEQNFITLDSLQAQEGKSYLLELNPQYVSGHEHTTLRPSVPIFESTQNPLR